MTHMATMPRRQDLMHKNRQIYQYFAVYRQCNTADIRLWTRRATAGLLRRIFGDISHGETNQLRFESHLFRKSEDDETARDVLSPDLDTRSVTLQHRIPETYQSLATLWKRNVGDMRPAGYGDIKFENPRGTNLQVRSEFHSFSLIPITQAPETPMAPFYPHRGVETAESRKSAPEGFNRPRREFPHHIQRLAVENRAGCGVYPPRSRRRETVDETRTPICRANGFRIGRGRELDCGLLRIRALSQTKTVMWPKPIHVWLARGYGNSKTSSAEKDETIHTRPPVQKDATVGEIKAYRHRNNQNGMPFGSFLKQYAQWKPSGFTSNRLGSRRAPGQDSIWLSHKRAFLQQRASFLHQQLLQKSPLGHRRHEFRKDNAASCLASDIFERLEQGISLIRSIMLITTFSTIIPILPFLTSPMDHPQIIRPT